MITKGKQNEFAIKMQAFKEVADKLDGDTLCKVMRELNIKQNASGDSCKILLAFQSHYRQRFGMNFPIE